MEETRKKMAPEAMSAMIWGIASIAAMAAFGFIASFVAYAKRKKSLALYEANPSQYNEKTLNLLKTAKITATIGLISSIFMTLFWIIYIIAIIYFVSEASNYNNYYYNY